ncbi:GlcNAc-PI de-N-acetylase [Chitinophaga costaii]|uniref:GlcNAc-PI de-N-acetylase n=1 Tax=Chitinophaga costaii TaxID=1335309 RepID=A0A1C3YUV1_9BACT|nr:PIG-L family deacetylase [Chitinophaga costaii]PUZ30113.1 hypothetical protein DCM91_01155 [Chitinophaga costaii]SCB73802.1 GlcNAc-PI de-N-acetylase [Chitinophaga costaii]
MQHNPTIRCYFIAHADDWQLFMAPEVSNDMMDKSCKVVIVHTTAGDAGKEEQYWKAREQAAIDSMIFCMSADESYAYKEAYVQINDKQLFTVTANNCTCYFLRLPDGAYDGSGFTAYGQQSLERFASGDIQRLESVDGTAAYNNWQELAQTLDAIIRKEADGLSLEDVLLCFPEEDVVMNPRDHNDHYNTAKLVRSTAAYQPCRKRAYVDYDILYTGGILNEEELFWKIGMFTTYHQSLYKLYGHSTIAEDTSFIPWCFKRSVYRSL